MPVMSDGPKVKSRAKRKKKSLSLLERIRRIIAKSAPGGGAIEAANEKIKKSKAGK